MAPGCTFLSVTDHPLQNCAEAYGSSAAVCQPKIACALSAALELGISCANSRWLIGRVQLDIQRVVFFPRREM